MNPLNPPLVKGEDKIILPFSKGELDGFVKLFFLFSFGFRFDNSPPRPFDFFTLPRFWAHYFPLLIL